MGVARAGSSPALGTNHPRWLPLLSAPAQGALAAALLVVGSLGGSKSQFPSIKLQISANLQ